MTLVTTAIWPQPLDPLHSTMLSALVAALPLILILVLMGAFARVACLPRLVVWARLDC
jgi:hypothetical protein